jgi:soluble lytic murein transglycosylase-like protein
MDDAVAKALHAVRHHLAGGGFLSDLFSGPDYLSTGKEASPTNWGDPESAADFFRADKALRLAREVQAPMTSSVPDRAPLTAPRPGPVEVQELPVNIPFAAPERGVPVMGASVAPASFATQPIAYSPEAPAAPAAAAIDQATTPATGKLTARVDSNSEAERANNVWNRMLIQESGGRQFDRNGNTITSPVGALGISQVMPSTGPEAAQLAGLPWSLERLRTDPEYNHALGRAYYEAQLERFGDPTLAAAAYNGGPGRVAGALRQARETGRPWTAFLRPETQNYVRVVTAQPRAHGGEVDDALRAVREHHADGEAVGQAPVATDNSERVRAAEDAANLAKQIQAYEASMASIRQQPQDIQSMTHAPEKPRAPISVEALGKNREFGSAPYDVAGPLSSFAQGAYDMKTLPLYMYPPTAPLGMAIDTAEGVASGSPAQVAMSALGGPLKVARNVIAPLAVATGVTAPDEAEAKSLSKVLQAIRAYQDPVAHKIADWNWRPLADVNAELGLTKLPPHVKAFGDYMKEMSDKAGHEGLSARDLLKGYTTTRASIQRRATDADNLRRLGLNLDSDVEKIRPEGAWMEWLGTPMGQRFLDEAAKGNISEDTVANAVKIMAPFGRHETDIPDAMRWAAKNIPGREVAASDLVHRAAQGASTPEEWRNFTSDIRGVGPSKSGFLASLYGRGDQPTLDARQIILNTGEPTKLAAPFIARSGGQGGVEAVNRLAARQAALGLKAPSKYDPFYQHLAHHAIWDKASNEMTTHGDIIKGMRNYADGGSVEDRALMLISKQA